MHKIIELFGFGLSKVSEAERSSVQILDTRVYGFWTSSKKRDGEERNQLGELGEEERNVPGGMI